MMSFIFLQISFKLFLNLFVQENVTVWTRKIEPEERADSAILICLHSGHNRNNWFHMLTSHKSIMKVSLPSSHVSLCTTVFVNPHSSSPNSILHTSSIHKFYTIVNSYFICISVIVKTDVQWLSGWYEMRWLYPETESWQFHKYTLYSCFINWSKISK